MLPRTWRIAGALASQLGSVTVPKPLFGHLRVWLLRCEREWLAGARIFAEPRNQVGVQVRQ